MSHCTSGDMMALGRGRTGEQCCGARAREMTRHNGENCDGDASECAAGEEMGEENPTGGPVGDNGL
jgi:hypothetical protein